MSERLVKNNQKPEDIARDKIDFQLKSAGWDIQNKNEVKWNKSIGIAVRYKVSFDECDREEDYEIVLNNLLNANFCQLSRRSKGGFAIAKDTTIRKVSQLCNSLPKYC